MARPRIVNIDEEIELGEKYKFYCSLAYDQSPKKRCFEPFGKMYGFDDPKFINILRDRMLAPYEDQDVVFIYSTSFSNVHLGIVSHQPPHFWFVENGYWEQEDFFYDLSKYDIEDIHYYDYFVEWKYQKEYEYEEMW